MHNFACDSNSINNVIQQSWKWPQLKLIVFFESHIILEAVLFKIQSTWVSLPHQSQCGLYWREDVITELLEQYFSDGSITNEDFYHIVFCALNNQLANFNNPLKENKQFTPRHSEHSKESLGNKKVRHSERSEESISYKKTHQPKLIIQLYSKTLHSFSINKPKNNCKLFIRSDRPLSPYIKTHKVISELILKQSFKDQMHYFSSSVGRKIRKANRNEIKVEVGSLKDLDLFYAIYRKRIHQLGSIGLPKNYFRHLLQNKHNCGIKLLLAFYKGRCIGTAILNIESTKAENMYFATDRKYNYLYPSYALHAKMIELSIEAKCEKYSFGRSTINSGVHHYKQQWGTKDKILYYNYSWNKKDHLWMRKFASFLIPLLPISFVRLFDHWVSKKWY